MNATPSSPSTGPPASLLAAFAVTVALLVGPHAASAQGACGPEVRGGLWLSGEDVTVADGSPVGELDSSGLALALAAACDVSDGVALGVDVEVDYGETLGQYRTLLTGELRITDVGDASGGGLTVSARGSAGWAFAAAGTSGSVLLVPEDTLALEEEASGPAVGASVRIGTSLTADLSAFLDAAWRASFLELTRFDPGGEEIGEEAETLHAFPVTAGVKLRL